MLMLLLQLEDDVITKPGYLTIMKDFVLSQKMNDWILLEFSHLGFIGQYVHTDTDTYTRGQPCYGHYRSTFS